MKMFWALFAILLLLSSTATAQQPADPASSPAGQPAPEQTRESELTQNMDKMAIAVTRMSEMCEKMMDKEMATMHYKIAAGIALAVLLTIALVLLIVLEFQWVIYWCRLLKSQHRS